MKIDTKNIIKLARLDQYIKNLLIFAPLFFAGDVTDINLLLKAFVAFVAFSLSASAIYILNDYKDIEEDRQHPRKKFRPLASANISKTFAIYLIGIFSAISILIMTALSRHALLLLVSYLLLNICYSFKLKHIPILDINIIAIGFVIRLFVGSVVTDTPLSKWIIIMTFLLALFLALAKRRDDVILYMNTNTKMRRVVDGYNLELINGGMMIMAAVIIVSYILYTTSETVIQRIQNEYLYLTVFFVILGFMRYLQITFVENRSGSPTKIVIKDLFLQITILGWILLFLWMIYA